MANYGSMLVTVQVHKTLIGLQEVLDIGTTEIPYQQNYIGYQKNPSILFTHDRENLTINKTFKYEKRNNIW